MDILTQYAIKEFTDLLVEHNFKLIEANSKNGPEGVEEFMLSKFLSYLIEKIVVKSLSHKIDVTKLNKTEAWALRKHYYQLAKTDIQNSVAEGFTRAMRRLGDNSIDFYCEVKPVPEPTNARHPC